MGTGPHLTFVMEGLSRLLAKADELMSQPTPTHV